ncbi:MAG: STY4851/ECs_5259 family protein [Methylococcaceae bacterium]
MTTHDWLKQFIFTHTRMSIPDGRPLYAYKCTEKKYLELKSMVLKLLLADLKNESAKQVPAIFCLYAAETFSREHTGGIWTWETVFHPLGMDIPDRNVIEHWVKNGLNWWCRPLLLGQNGYRRFLVSIACEGGLPLRLLENDSAAINHFFRSILENYHAMGCGGLEAAQQVAVLNAYRLPPVLRQDVVFRLSGELISSVVDLQTKYEIGRVKNPIAVLDEKDFNWRKTLPLMVEDGVAETLFNGLLKRSDQLARATNAKLRWIGKLHQTESGYKIEKVLELPEIVSGELVQQWLGQNSEPPPPRLQFVLNTNSGSQTIARLTLCAGSGETARYRRELLRKDGVRLFNEEVSEFHSLFLHDGQKEHPLDVKSGESWNEALPWIFTEKSATNEFEFFGEGSVRTKEEKVFVLANETLKPHAFGGGSFEVLAYIQELNRTVWRVVGEVDFITEELDRYRIACKSEDDLSESCQIVGDVLIEVNNFQPVYRGLPNIKIGNVKNKNCYRTQWRAVNGAKNWQDCDFDDLAFGNVWLRLQNKEDKTEIYRRKILVVPKTFRIETVIGGADSTNGIYRLKGFKGAVVSTDLQSETSTVSDDNIEINCPMLESTNFPDLLVTFHWTTANLQIKLPYPQRGAIFQISSCPKVF